MKNKIQQLTIILIILKQVFSSGFEIVKYYKSNLSCMTYYNIEFGIPYIISINIILV